MNDKKVHKHVNFNVDPNKTPVYYADGYLIGSGQHVVTLNFTQALPMPPDSPDKTKQQNTQQQNIVSRVALTRDQAKGFLKDLQNHMDKYEV